MARIRTIKPEFWEDETVGMLSVHARLLFVATWNLADDEGLLRWSPAFIKANVFMYDDVSLDQITACMAELADHGLVFPYKGGKAQQRLAWIVNFRVHQRINRPQPGKLPAPSLQNRQVARAYADRDGWSCHLCGGEINDPPSKDDRLNLSLDHLTPRSDGGDDYPSNVAASHQSCNKSRRNTPLEDYTARSMNGSVNGHDTVSALSLAEGEGKGREAEGNRDKPVSGADAPNGQTKALAVVAEVVDEGAELFGEWWDRYPRRGNGAKGHKGKAREKWLRLSPDERRRAWLGAEHYAAAGQGPMDAHRFLTKAAGEFEFDQWQEPPVGDMRAKNDGTKAAILRFANGA